MTSSSVALAFDHAGDCRIYNVGTLEHERRRSLATALTALQLQEARGRGLRTASVQSTEMTERVHAAVGFRDLGRILEYTFLADPRLPPRRVFLAFADDEAAMGRVDAALSAMSPGEGGGGRTAVETYEVLLDESR